MRETAQPAVMVRVDADGTVIGFSVLGVSPLPADRPLEMES